MGLVLTGGGARGAYQAGALSALLEIAQPHFKSWPFPVITGTSAGAINASYIASEILDRPMAQLADDLVELWSDIKTRNVFRSDPVSVAWNGVKWMKMLSAGGLFPSKRGFALFNATPLRMFLERHMDISKIERSIARGALRGIGITSVCYNSGVSRTFYQGSSELKDWHRTQRHGERHKIGLQHIMASASIPIFFPPIKIGEKFYGDGSLRDYTPLSPAIKMGAEKLIVIGVRKSYKHVEEHLGAPGPAKIFSLILNGLLLDSLDLDLERLHRINQTVGGLDSPADFKLKKVDTLVLCPSQDIGGIAERHFDELPVSLKYFINGLGKPEDTADLISYILFESGFTGDLIELGRKDVYAQKKKVLDYLLME
ncbi:MAG: patatin-like phospholipase family protein [Bacteriovoracaceae bacterium]|nr:patatin-like phospholipase family protein [Bacteriovoracaceae bacterium]